MNLWKRWIDELAGSFNVTWLAGAALALLCVLGLTHMPRSAMPEFLQEHNFDKVEHVLAYGAITMLYMLSLKKQPVNLVAEGSRKRRRWEVRGWLSLAVLGVLGLVFVGAIDELTQPFVNRTCSVWDWAADAVGTVGICVSFVVGWALVKRQPPESIPEHLGRNSCMGGKAE
jgi:VanZ family protein